MIYPDIGRIPRCSLITRVIPCIRDNFCCADCRTSEFERLELLAKPIFTLSRPGRNISFKTILFGSGVVHWRNTAAVCKNALISPFRAVYITFYSDSRNLHRIASIKVYILAWWYKSLCVNKEIIYLHKRVYLLTSDPMSSPPNINACFKRTCSQ